MGFICFDCIDKLNQVEGEALKVVGKRLNSGEDVISILVEFENEREKLDQEEKIDTKKYFFAKAVVELCEGMLAYRAVHAAGWEYGPSGFLVKRSED